MKNFSFQRLSWMKTALLFSLTMMTSLRLSSNRPTPAQVYQSWEIIMKIELDWIFLKTPAEQLEFLKAHELLQTESGKILLVNTIYRWDCHENQISENVFSVWLYLIRLTGLSHRWAVYQVPLATSVVALAAKIIERSSSFKRQDSYQQMVGSRLCE